MRDNPARTDASPVLLTDRLAPLNELHHCPLLNMRRSSVLAGFCVNTGFASLESVLFSGFFQAETTVCPT